MPPMFKSGAGPSSMGQPFGGSGGPQTYKLPTPQGSMPFRSPSTPAPTNANGIAGAFQGVNPARAGYDVGNAAIMANQGQGLTASMNSSDQAPAQYMRGMLDGLRSPPNMYGQQQQAYNPYSGNQSYGPQPFPGPFPDLATYGPFSGSQYVGYAGGGSVGSDDDDDESGGGAFNPYGKEPKRTIEVPDGMVFASDKVATPWGLFSRKGAYRRGLLPGQPNYVDPAEWSAVLGRDPVTFKPVTSDSQPVSGPKPAATIAIPADLERRGDLVATGFGFMPRAEAYARGLLLPDQPNYEPPASWAARLGVDPVTMQSTTPVTTPPITTDPVTTPPVTTPPVTTPELIDTPRGRMTLAEASDWGYLPEQIAASKERSDRLMAAHLREMEALSAARAAARAALPPEVEPPDAEDDDDDGDRPRGGRTPVATPAPTPVVSSPSSVPSSVPATSSPSSTPSSTPAVSSPSSVPSEASKPDFGMSAGMSAFRNFLNSRASSTPAATSPTSRFQNMRRGIASLGPRAAGFRR